MILVLIAGISAAFIKGGETDQVAGPGSLVGPTGSASPATATPPVVVPSVGPTTPAAGTPTTKPAPRDTSADEQPTLPRTGSALVLAGLLPMGLGAGLARSLRRRR